MTATSFVVHGRFVGKLTSATAFLAAFLFYFCLVAISSQAAEENSYPSKPIWIVVPAAPGGVTDILPRLIGQKLSERLGQPVLIENKPGAATIVGATHVARARPDGYTLLSAPFSTLIINPAVYRQLSYSQDDFIPISNLASFPYVLSVSNTAPVKTVRELVEYIKANPSVANAGGAAVTFQLLTDYFKRQTGTPIQYVPFRGSNETAIALSAGHLLMSFIDTGTAIPQINAQQFRALAVTSKQRVPSLPDVPTMEEAGIPGMEITTWSGLFAPRNTPPDVTKKLQDAIVDVVKQSDIQERMRQLALDPIGSGSEEFARTIRQDSEKWAAIAKASEIKID